MLIATKKDLLKSEPDTAISTKEFEAAVKEFRLAGVYHTSSKDSGDYNVNKAFAKAVKLAL